ncbi:hypothetical protein MNBD_ALPHA06-914 [hydrothermal vent metagenome]|uniref:Lipoprotein n=1 Tax=hydrothermal vent metagenome TaxID=652676 RepID=A0A3B0SKM8_9ZZZZ
MFISRRFSIAIASLFLSVGLISCSDKGASENTSTSAESSKDTAAIDPKTPESTSTKTAETPPAEPVIVRPGRSDAELLNILKNNGSHHAQLVKPGTFRIQKEGDSYLLFVKKDGSLRLYYKYHGSAHVSSEQMRHWNQDEPHTNAHFDSDSKPALARNYKFGTGLRSSEITNFVQSFHESVTKFQDTIEFEDH